MRYEEYNYCMRRKCKECKVNKECDLLIKNTKRLTFKPFENIDKLLEEKRSKRYEKNKSNSNV